MKKRGIVTIILIGAFLLSIAAIASAEEACVKIVRCQNTDGKTYQIKTDKCPTGTTGEFIGYGYSSDPDGTRVRFTVCDFNDRDPATNIVHIGQRLCDSAEGPKSHFIAYLLQPIAEQAGVTARVYECVDQTQPGGIILYTFGEGHTGSGMSSQWNCPSGYLLTPDDRFQHIGNVVSKTPVSCPVVSEMPPAEFDVSTCIDSAYASKLTPPATWPPATPVAGLTKEQIQARMVDAEAMIQSLVCKNKCLRATAGNTYVSANCNKLSNLPSTQVQAAPPASAQLAQNVPSIATAIAAQTSGKTQTWIGASWISKITGRVVAIFK